MASKKHEIAVIEALKRDWQRINADDNKIAGLISRQVSSCFPRFASDTSGVFARIVGQTGSRADREAAEKIHDDLGKGNSVETTIAVKDTAEGQASLYLTVITNGCHLNR